MFSCLPQLERAVTEQRWVQPSPSLWAWEFSESHRNVSDLAVTSLKNPFQCGRHFMQVLTVEPQPCSLRQFSTKEHPSACMCMHARIHAHTPASSTCSALLWTVRGTSLNLVSSELYSLRVYSGMQYEEIHTPKSRIKIAQKNTSAIHVFRVAYLCCSGPAKLSKSNYLHWNLMSYLELGTVSLCLCFLIQKKKEEISQVHWHMHVIPTLVRQRQENQEFRAWERYKVCISEHGPRDRALSHVYAAERRWQWTMWQSPVTHVQQKGDA